MPLSFPILIPQLSSQAALGGFRIMDVSSSSVLTIPLLTWNEQKVVIFSSSFVMRTHIHANIPNKNITFYILVLSPQMLSWKIRAWARGTACAGTGGRGLCTMTLAVGRALKIVL